MIKLIAEILDMAQALDKKGQANGANILDKAAAKIIQAGFDDEDEFFGGMFDDPAAEDTQEASPFDTESRYEAGGREADVIPLEKDEPLYAANMTEELISFVTALADGAYADISEATEDAKALLEIMEDADDELHELDMKEQLPGEEPEEGMGTVLPFPKPE